MGFKRHSLFPQQEAVEFGWWVKISTSTPHGTYYFGPFSCEEFATVAQAGYVEDLEQEGVEEISVQIEQCQPQALTL